MKGTTITEEEKRLHRCCFSGHRPEKLEEPEETIKSWLSEQIDKAITDGYVTFISGCAMGVDIWAGQIILQRNEWMVDHSNRVIAYFNGAPGGTKNTIDYAAGKGIEVITNNPNYEPKPKRRRKQKEVEPGEQES